MNTNIYWHELDASQIYVEILKRFPSLKDETGGNMSRVFGKGWGLLNLGEREIAEERFRNGIMNKVIKGIIYDHLGKGILRTDTDGNVLYKRIPNDIYKI